MINTEICYTELILNTLALETSFALTEFHYLRQIKMNMFINYCERTKASVSFLKLHKAFLKLK